MKHILLSSVFLLLNILASAQAMKVSSSPNSQGKQIVTSSEVKDDAPINDIQAMVRQNNPSHTLSSGGRGRIIVEEEVLFAPNGNKNTIGKAGMKLDPVGGSDVEILTELNATEGKSKEKLEESSVVSQNAYKNASTIVGSGFSHTILDKNRQNAAQNQDTDSYISISPNPINEAATVLIEQGPLSIHGTFHVFDITGRLIIGGNFEGNQFILERKNLNKGVYILSVLSENKVIASKKIVMN
jgi:hypothetical protein